MRHYSKILGRRAWDILWGPIERFITVVGGLVGILVVFNQRLIDWLVGAYQGIPWWVGLVILGGLLLQAFFRAGYKLWQDAEQERKDAEQARVKLERELEEAQSSALVGASGHGSDTTFIERVVSERDEAQKKLRTRENNEWLRRGVADVREQRREALKEEIERLTTERDEATAERDALREEKRQNLQEVRRKRIEEWRFAIRNFDFDAEEFTSTDTYSEIREHLQPDPKRRLEHPEMIIVGNRKRGEYVRRRILLDEVARIEKEWGLI